MSIRVLSVGRFTCGGGAWQPGRLPHNRTDSFHLVGQASRLPSGRRKRTACGGGAILGIVGCADIVVGMVPRANNAQGGSAREGRAESRPARGTLKIGTGGGRP